MQGQHQQAQHQLVAALEPADRRALQAQLAKREAKRASKVDQVARGRAPWLVVGPDGRLDITH
ncbi:hypothetical protein D3C85_1588070 [compost metagenome]